MLRRSYIVRSGTSFIHVVSGISNQTMATSLKEILERPQLKVQSLSLIPPPRWAAELSRKIKTVFPELQLAHQTRQLQAFIHPSFITDKIESTTMRQLSPLGEVILLHIVCRWVFQIFEDLKREEASSLIAVLVSDLSLSRIVRDVWRLENMVLTDASANLFSREKLRSAKGLMQWLAVGEKNGMPDPFLAECLKAFITVVYIEKGMDSAISFCHEHILPYLE
ncbi:unnamed protein product [Phytomonas sp. Hart1]|nr:unnamed protein product [Phytomonas sp. Hart1]|eukprot:CCW71069.1 unnamed protein product [Phytomonas sp. isolate Hart1]